MRTLHDLLRLVYVWKGANEHPVILLCNHRSQVDSFAIYSTLYDNGDVVPPTSYPLIHSTGNCIVVRPVLPTESHMLTEEIYLDAISL